MKHYKLFFKLFFSFFVVLLFLFFSSCSVNESQRPIEENTEWIDDNNKIVTESGFDSEERKSLEGLPTAEVVFNPDNPFGEIEVQKSGGAAISYYIIYTYWKWVTWWRYDRGWYKWKKIHEAGRKVKVPVYANGRHGAAQEIAPYTLRWIKIWNRNGTLQSDIDYTDEKQVNINSVVIQNKNATDLLNGDTTILRANVNTSPGDAEVDRSVTWTSDNPSVATVDSNGKVTAKSLGTVTITAENTKKYKNGKKKDSITLNVVNFKVSMRVFIPELKVKSDELFTSSYKDWVPSPAGAFAVDGNSGGYRLFSSEDISFKGEVNQSLDIGKSVKFNAGGIDVIDAINRITGRLKPEAVQERVLLQMAK